MINTKQNAKNVLAILILAVNFLAVTKANAFTTPQDENRNFAVLRIKIAKADDQYNIKLEGSKFEQGIFKNNNSLQDTGKADDFVFTILNEQHQPMEKRFVSNPLSVRLEYPADDKSTLNSKTVDLKENEIMLRFNYVEEIKYLLVSKINKDGTYENITTLNINIH